MFVFEKERERDRESMHMRVGKGEKERERERIPSRLPTVSAESDVGLSLTNHGIMA